MSDASPATVTSQRWLLAAVLLGGCVLVLPTVEPFMLPKLTWIWLLTIAVVGVGVARAVWNRRAAVPVGPVTVAAAVWLAAVVVVTVASASPMHSLLGAYGHFAGLSAYLAYALVLLSTATVVDGASAGWLRKVALVALAIVVGYGLLQAIGADPAHWQGESFNATASFFGNVDFASGWVGSLTAVALVTAAQPFERREWRLAAAVVLVAALAYLVIAGTSQGLIVAAVSLLWAGAVLAWTPGSRLRALTVRRPGVAVAAVTGLVVVVAAVVAVGWEFIQTQLSQALVERPAFWSAALGMFRDHPALGTGLDTYGNHFLVYRPLHDAVTYGSIRAVEPHSVPLGMFSEGGLLLGLTYLAFVVAVAWTLVRGLRRADGTGRVALATFGGVWLGYQAQSLVSQDVPPLALLEWISAGVIVAAAGFVRWKTLNLPGSAPARNRTRRGKEYGPVVVPGSTRLLQGVVVVAALVAAWFALYPVRADMMAATAAPLGASGHLDAAINRLHGAADLYDANGTYTFLAAEAEKAAGQHEAAARDAAQASALDPGNEQYIVLAAREAYAAGDQSLAGRYYRASVRLDPNYPPVLAEAAGYFYTRHQNAIGDAYARRALALDPTDSQLRSQLQALKQAGAK